MPGEPTGDANCSFLANHCSSVATKCSSVVCLSDRRGERTTGLGCGRRQSGAASPALVLVEGQRHFWTGRHTVASQLLILGPHLVLFEDRIARIIDGEQVWIDGVTLSMAYAFGFFETNPHKVPSLDGAAGKKIRRSRSVKSRRSLPTQVGHAEPRSAPSSRIGALFVAHAILVCQQKSVRTGVLRTQGCVGDHA